MENLISPKYQMKLVGLVEQAICNEYKTNELIYRYLTKWKCIDTKNYNFSISFKDNSNYYSNEIELNETLHNMDVNFLLKIAIELGVETPDFIPSIPIFKNELKSNYKNAYDCFLNAYKQIEKDPSSAVGYANSTLESIIKEILKDERFLNKITGSETLYKLTEIILKEFNISYQNPLEEIKKIGSSLLCICQHIEKLRSEKTNFHGKTSDDYLIDDAIYTHYIINTITTVGLFLISYYKKKYPKPIEDLQENDLPF